MNKKEIILLGAGGHCKACIDVIEQENKYSIYGILDKKEHLGKNVLGYEIIGTDNEIPDFVKKTYSFLITIGQIHTSSIRIKLFKILSQLNAFLPVIISPSSYVSKHANIDEGTIIMHKAVIQAGVKIGKNCIINDNALIEHESIIGDNCHISTGAIINGNVKIGNDCFVGSGSVTIQGKILPDKTFIKAQSLFK